MSVHQAIYDQYGVALSRKKNGGSEKSYTVYLYSQGIDKILKKCGEETFETVIAAKNGDHSETVGELNDVIYHVTVMLCECGVPMDAVFSALNTRCACESKTFEELLNIIRTRREDNSDESYTAYLFRQGIDKILKKVGEACSLLLIAAKNGSPSAIADETADLFFHLMVMMIEIDLPAELLEDELTGRSSVSGNLKTFHTTDHNS